MKLLRIYCLFSFILTVASSNLNSKIESDNRITSDSFVKSAIDCTVSLTYKYMPCGTLITLVSKVTYMEPLYKLLNDRNCYKFIIRSFRRQQWFIWTNFYIISEVNFIQFYLNFNNLTKNTAWNPKAQFIILIYDLRPTEYDDVFKLLMKLNIFNIILLTKSENGTLKINTYDPFDNNGCGRSFNEVINIKDCDSIDNIRTKYYHLEGKYRNCTITISGIEDVPNFIYATNKEFYYLDKNTEGLEQYMFSNFAKEENITLEYILAEPGLGYGVVLPNWTATGALGYLQNNTVSIAAGGYLLMLNRVISFDFICGYRSATFLLFTPALSDSHWTKVYRQFSGSTWFLIALSYFFISIVTTLTGRYLMGHNDANRLVIILWGHIFGNKNEKLLLLKKLRKFVILWVWFAFFITSFYSSAFYTLLTTKTIKKLTYVNKTLDSLPLKPCISDTTRTFFKYKYNDTLPGKSTSQCKNVDRALEAVANGNEFYALEKDYSYNMREFKYIDDEGHHKLEIFRYTNNIMSAMYITRGFPLKEKLQRYARYHMEAGLLQNQVSLINHRYNMFKKHFSHSFKNLSLTDLRIPFIILFFGYIVSFICFIIEIER